MKIMVMGHGAVGSVLCDLFAREKSVKSVVCAERVINHLKNKGKIHFKKTNFSSKKQVEGLIKKERPDLLINSSLPIFNKSFLQACLENKVNYMDMASYWDLDKNPRAKSPYKVEQLDFNEKFKKKGIVGLINVGASPGLTNLLAKECVDLFDTVDSIKIRLFEDSKSILYFPWSVEWLLDEINWKPLVYRNGKFKVMKSFSEEEEYKFPNSLGKKKVLLASQEEVGTIPLFLKVNSVDLKIFDNQGQFLKLLSEIGLTNEYDVSVKGEKIVPVELLSKLLKEKKDKFINMKVPEDAQFAFVVEASGLRNGKRKTAGFQAIFPKQGEIDMIGLQATFISYPTAIAAKTFAMEILKIKDYGVYPAENLDKNTRHNIIRELKKYVKIKSFER